MFITWQNIPILATAEFERSAWVARADFWIELDVPDSFELRWDFQLMYCGL